MKWLKEKFGKKKESRNPVAATPSQPLTGAGIPAAGGEISSSSATTVTTLSSSSSNSALGSSSSTSSVDTSKKPVTDYTLQGLLDILNKYKTLEKYTDPQKIEMNTYLSNFRIQEGKKPKGIGISSPLSVNTTRDFNKLLEIVTNYLSEAPTQANYGTMPTHVVSGYGYVPGKTPSGAVGAALKASIGYTEIPLPPGLGTVPGYGFIPQPLNKDATTTSATPGADKDTPLPPGTGTFPGYGFIPQPLKNATTTSAKPEADKTGGAEAAPSSSSSSTTAGYGVLPAEGTSSTTPGSSTVPGYGEIASKLKFK